MTVAIDLSGERLDAVLPAGPALVEVGHTELIDDGRAADDSPEALVAALRRLREEGPARSSSPAPATRGWRWSATTSSP